MPESDFKTPRTLRKMWRSFHPEVRTSTKIISFSIIGALGVFFAWAMVVSIPSVDSFENRKVSESTKIYDRTGNVLLYDVHGSMRRTDVPLSEISIFIQNATIAIEDDTFYQHKGIRPLSILRAVWANITSGGFSQGGSTITQQVVKNTLLTQDKTIIRKMKEWVLAIKLERATTKDKILEIYLNENPYGGTIYGIEEASEFFFGKLAKDVTLAEAAYLAALPRAPTRYSPYGNHRDELEDRKNLVLAQMQKLGVISAEEYEAAMKETVEFKQETEAGIKAPHFVFFIREYLEEKYGADVVSNSGLRVITTLDYDLQKKAEVVVEKGALANKKNFNAENAGLVAIDPKTGQILSMVGSRGYFDEEIDGKVNVTLAKRQPGSSFKPFVYAAAFEKGYTPETILFDLATQFTGYCSPNDLATHDNCYSPGNYDEKYRGPMSLRDALAQSINVVAVKVLYLVGLDDALNMAKRMGITTLVDKSRYGLTLVLGGGEVTLLEMTGAYAGYANDGILNPPTGILEIKEGEDVLEKYEDKGSRVVEPQIARTLNDVLSDDNAKIPAFGANSALTVPGHNVAAKTGTTNDYRDAWIIGYTPGLAAGAWAGNNDNSVMEKKVAGFIIAPIWNEFMRYALEKYPSEDFAPVPPDPEYDSLPPVLRGNWNSDPSRGVHEILFWVNKDNPRSGPPSNPSADPQFVLWEYPVSLWANQQPINPGGTGVIDFVVASPSGGQVYKAGTRITAAVEYESSLSIKKVTYYLNDALIGSATEAPFELEFIPTAGPAVLKAVADTLLGPRENSVSFGAQ
ncbi:MAG: 1A family penicillin-binding protein [Parcubacteria group bacterium Gr01-1014_8]|nr:MAG: 1A family penicillin-binding protein [Parcubacteria group bacterium Gr01-1014_8]